MDLRHKRSVVFYIFIFTTCLYTLCGAKGNLFLLNEDNWDQMLQGEWMVEFFAPWCPACKTLNPIWKEFSTWSDDLSISVGQVDVTSSPELSGRFMVTALPTIYHIKDGVFRQYHGTRSKEEFMSFIEEKKWTSLEEMSPWKNPASIQMAIIAKFFKMSMLLRNVHTTIVEDYGLPTWGSYLVFALSTIIVGALLGLVLVCIIDYVFPPKSMSAMSTLQASGKKSDEEDLPDEKDDEDEEKKESDSEEEKKETDSEEEKKEPDSEEKAESAEQSGSQAENSEHEVSPSGSPSVRKRKPRKAD